MTEQELAAYYEQIVQESFEQELEKLGGVPQGLKDLYQRMLSSSNRGPGLRGGKGVIAAERMLAHLTGREYVPHALRSGATYVDEVIESGREAARTAKNFIAGK